MDNLDDWLNSLNVETSENPPSVPASTHETSVVATPQPESFSEDDLLDILADNGYSMTPVAEAEEITDEEEQEGEEEEEDNTFSYRDVAQSSLETILPDNPTMVVHQATLNADGTITAHPSNGQDVILLSPDPEPESTAHVSIGDEQADVPIIHEEAPVATSDDGPLIPPNSPTLLMDESTSRFSGTEWYNEIQKQRIILAGLGGIGSWAAIQLARMNPAAMFLYDDDTVERANMSGQFYSNTQVGAHKTSAVLNAIMQYTNMRSVNAIPEKFTEDTEAGNVMICGFDSMTARKLFFNRWHEHVREKSAEERKQCLYIDGRLSVDCLQVFCITGDDTYNIKRYEDEFLFSDSKADATVCSMKQTTYLACMIGSFMVNLFTNWVANLLNPAIPYDLPFFTEYDAKNMLFKTEN